MINILIPIAGENKFFPEAEYPFPKPLIELKDKTIIERIIENFDSISDDKQFIFIVNNEDCQKYHIDNVLKILTDNHCKIIKINGKTSGAACSAMMAVEYIDNDSPLIISNADQLMDISFQEAIQSFTSYDAGTITFESVHPRWSYVRLDEHGRVVETTEKKPISKHAIAGFYYFKHGRDFIQSAAKMIQKDANTNGLYYIAPSLNEMILDNKRVGVYKIDNGKYHTLYTPQKLKEYERLLANVS